MQDLSLRSPLYRLVVIVVVAGVAVAGSLAALVPAGAGLRSTVRTPSGGVDLGPLDQRSYVYGADGTLLATLQAEIDRQPVPLSAVPRIVSGAVLAVEDAGFYAHGGVDVEAMVRALMTNVEAGGVSQGGSTLTQQLVKTELLSGERSVRRKVQEAVLAERLEDELSKDEILERYLNVVYFGNGAYGVQAAAETYFDRGVRDLGPAQAAMLAGLVANPSRFDPVKRPEAARERRAHALSRMVDVGLLSTDEARAALEEPLPTEVTKALPAADSYFVEEVKQQLLDDPRLGATRDEREYAVFRGGLRIHTTLDPGAQFLAEASRNQVLAEVSPEGTAPGTTPLAPPTADELRAAGMDAYTGPPRWATGVVVSVEPGSGAVRAMVGGPGFDRFKVNIATRSPGRQGGSSFKVFVLMALLENGFVPRDSVSGSGPCRFALPDGTDYEVSNFDNSRGGTADITSQTLRSSNCAYVRLGQIVGLDKVVHEARQMGLTAALDASVVSMPLGTVEVRPVEMAAAYASIAADGVYEPPYLVDRVLDPQGDELLSHRQDPRRAASPQSARLAAAVLERNVLTGTGTRARIASQHVAGKTGTAQDSSNGWFVGFTRHLATAVWIGDPEDNFGVRIGGRGITGGGLPAEIWRRYMAPWHEGRESLPFEAAAPTRSGRFLRVDAAVDPRGSSKARPSGRRSSGRSTTSTTTTAPAPTTTVPPTSTTEAPAALPPDPPAPGLP